MTSQSDQHEPGHAGILETMRDMPRYTRFALLGTFINQFGAFLQAFMVLYLLQRGFGETDAGLALGAYALGGIFGTVCGGWLTDRLGTRLTISLAVGGASLMTLSVTMLPTIEGIVLAVFLAGALTLVSRPAVTALLLRSVPAARQVMVQAMFRTALNTGAAFGPLMAAWLSTVNWNLVFYVDASAAMIYCLIALFLFPGRERERADERAAGNDKPATGKTTYFTMLRDIRYVGYLVIMFVNGLIHVQAFVVLPLMLASAGMPTWVYSITITVSAVLVITTELLITKVTQRWAIWAAVLLGWLLFVTGRGMFGLFELISTATLAVVLLVLVSASLLSGLGQIIGGPAAFAYPARVAPSDGIGKYLGSAFGSFQIGYTIGPAVGVALWLQWGAVFWLMLPIIGGAMAVLLVWSMRPPTSPPVVAEPATDPVGDQAAEVTDQPAPEEDTVKTTN